jgi:type VI protein secretion system component Hcp
VIKKVILHLAASTALAAGTATAENEYFIKIDGIPGTANQIGLTDFIQVESWALGFEDGHCQALQFVKKMDASSANLTGAALSGAVFPRIVLIARKPGEQPFTYLRLTLTNSVFKSFKTAGGSNEIALPTEQVSAQPSAVKTDVYAQDERGGSVRVATSNVACP